LNGYIDHYFKEMNMKVLQTYWKRWNGSTEQVVVGNWVILTLEAIRNRSKTGDSDGIVLSAVGALKAVFRSLSRAPITNWMTPPPVA
jgi:hypothetical protein